MSGLKFADFAAPKTAPTTTARDDRPAAQVWLNIGINVDMSNPETGETETVFVSLPLGLPVDTMEPLAMRGSNANWANMVQAKNYVLEELQKMAAGVAPGEGEFVDGLKIQIKRVGTAAAPAQGENPLLAAMTGRLAVVK